MAETRETQVLEDVIESTEIENPRTTEEAILAQVIAGEEVTINARTRLQKYLSQLTSGGSSIEVEPLTVTENGTKTAPEGKAYSPVTVDVPYPNTIAQYVAKLNNPFAGHFMDLFNGATGVSARFDITSSITFIFGGQSVTLFLTGSTRNGSIYTASYTGYNVSNGSLSTFVYVEYTYDSDNNSLSASYAKRTDISGGAAVETDLSSYLSLINSTCTIMQHPIPE